MKKPKVDQIEVLKPERLSYWCERVGIPNEMLTVLEALRGTILSDSNLSTVMEEYHERLAIRNEWVQDWTVPEPILEVTALMGEDSWGMDFLAYLTVLPVAEVWYQEKGISLDIFDATMSDIGVWVCNYHENHGSWGFSQFGWIHLHLSCRLFRLGRLQFRILKYPSEVLFLKHRRLDRYIGLALPGNRLRQDGHADGADGRTDPDYWFPEYRETTAGWSGNPISPYGCVLREIVYLPAKEWDIVLQKGDRVIDMHIPQGGKLDMSECRESISKAETFFAHYFPEMPFHAFFCDTWLFAPQLQVMLEGKGNIVKFQREFHLTPGRGDRTAAWERIFGMNCRTLEEAPRESTIQKAFYEWLKQGSEFFGLPGVHFHPAVKWGSQPYMEDWDRNGKIDIEINIDSSARTRFCEFS